MAYVMKACIILHDMMIESRRDYFYSLLGSLQQVNNLKQLLNGLKAFQ